MTYRNLERETYKALSPNNPFSHVTEAPKKATLERVVGSAALQFGVGSLHDAENFRADADTPTQHRSEAARVIAFSNPVTEKPTQRASSEVAHPEFTSK